MYFTIIRDNGYVKKFILSFSEIESVTIDDSLDKFTYYNLSIKALRKIKLLSINNLSIKEKLSTLQNLLNDVRFIKKYDKIPEPAYNFVSYSSGYGMYSFSIRYTIGTIESKPKINTKNISYKNRFVGKVNKKIDLHKSNYKIK